MSADYGKRSPINITSYNHLSNTMRKILLFTKSYCVFYIWLTTQDRINNNFDMNGP